MDVNEITKGKLESPAALIELAESLTPSLRSQEAPIRWAFRGQSQAYGTLVPSFQRIFSEKRYAGAAEMMERDLIKTFRVHYEKLKDRTHDMPQPYQIGEGFDLRCLSTMQHYGVPTRLLDWTSHFWTAVYFACTGDPSKDAELWIYNRDYFFEPSTLAPEFLSLLQPSTNNVSPNIEPDLLSWRYANLIVELDPQLTPRMKEQFAHHTLSSDVLADHVPLLLNRAREKNSEGDIAFDFRRILITAACKEKTLRFLADQKNITAGTIFPDVEGLGKFLHWHLQSLVTTLL